MRVSSLIFGVVVLVLVISLLCIRFYPSVQDFMATNSMWNGIRAFDDEFKAKIIDNVDVLPALPEKTVLVEIPYLKYSDTELSEVKRFVGDGGTLLLMDDYGYGNEVLTYFGLDVRFSNKTLLDPLFDYKNQSMPRITDFRFDVKESGVTVMTFNHATVLTNVKQSEEIAWSSAASFLDSDDNQSWSDNESKGPFPVAAKVSLGKGTVAIIADPSIIISSMMDRDNNYRFLEYLITPKGESKEILFDTSHLTKTPLDVSKERLLGIREAMSGPYALVGITAMIFGVVSYYTLRKGEAIG